ncbi:hypothetical protein Hanom_Chr10g00891781 [Helianthus anomalus]
MLNVSQDLPEEHHRPNPPTAADVSGGAAAKMTPVCRPTPLCSSLSLCLSLSLFVPTPVRRSHSRRSPSFPLPSLTTTTQTMSVHPLKEGGDRNTSSDSRPVWLSDRGRER